jgi:transcriptional regulator with GAF, ATPase, and Fis domain
VISKGLIGSGKAFTNVLEEIRMVAPLACSVLIQGETGTGKEVVARAIHSEGKRRDRPFIALNCAAIPSALLESELFGHEKGAFTGAVSQTVGRFQAAQGGTLFLDEIGDLPLELQPKLLRVLQEQQFERVGSARTIQADVRVIAATNLHLQEMVEEKSFRADLFYRLSVFPLVLPPLRDRKDDIDQLVHHFVGIYSARLGKDIVHVPEAILDIVHGYHWPGNIRELQNFIERAIITSPGDTLSPRPGELELLSRCPPVQRVRTLLDAERAHIIQTLTETNWVVGGRNGAAARLGLPRTTLISRMQKLGLSRKRSEPTVDFSLPQSFSDSLSGPVLLPA